MRISDWSSDVCSSDLVGGAQLALAHAVTDHLAAAELHFLAVSGEVLFDLDPQLGIGQAHLVANGGAEHVRGGLSADIHRGEGESGVGGKSVAVRVGLGGRRIIKKKIVKDIK